VRSAVRILRARSDNLPINPAQELIRIDVYLKENMPPTGRVQTVQKIVEVTNENN